MEFREGKFTGYALTLQYETVVRDIISHLRQKHLTATHASDAWQMGIEPGE